MDMDGCLTTGHIIYSSSGDNLKMFHTHDGFGITRGRELGLKFAVISGMSSLTNKMRVERLKIHHLYEDIDDKLLPFKVKKHVDYVCKKNGGEGAVREIIDMILKAKGLI